MEHGLNGLDTDLFILREGLLIKFSMEINFYPCPIRQIRVPQNHFPSFR
jgi:hypothetical protein